MEYGRHISYLCQSLCNGPGMSQACIITACTTVEVVLLCEFSHAEEHLGDLII